MNPRENKYRTLNINQQRMIEAALDFYFDDIVQTLIDNPELAVEALMAVKEVNFTSKAKFEVLNILDSIEQIRGILAHPCPQNSNRDFHSDADDESGLRRLKMTNLPKLIKIKHANGDIEFHNGRIIRKHFILTYDTNNDSLIFYEQAGRLGLTKHEDEVTPPATKTDVTAYIHDLIDSRVALMRSLSPELKAFIQTHAETVREWLVCKALTLQTLIEIGPEAAAKLVDQTEIVILLLKRARIPVKKLAEDDELRREFINHHQALIQLIEEGGLTWNDVAAWTQSQRALFFSFVDILCKFKKAKVLDLNKIKDFWPTDLFFTEILSAVKIEDFPNLVVVMIREAWLRKLFRDGTHFLVILRSLDLPRRLALIDGLGRRVCYFIRTLELIDKFEDCLQGHAHKSLDGLRDLYDPRFKTTTHETLKDWFGPAANDIGKATNDDDNFAIQAVDDDAETLELIILRNQIGVTNPSILHNLGKFLETKLYIARLLYELGAIDTEDAFKKANSNRKIKREIDYATSLHRTVIIKDLHETGLLTAEWVDYAMESAIENRAANIINALVAIGVKMDLTKQLLRAVKTRYQEGITILVNAGAANCIDEGSRCLLELAIMLDPKYFSAIQLLIDKGANIKELCAAILVELIRSANLPALNRSLLAGLNLNSDHYRSLPLLQKCIEGFPNKESIEQARLLIRYGTTVDTRTVNKLRHLQMLMPYNENFARAQKNRFVPPNSRFIREFYLLYTRQRCHPSAFLFSHNPADRCGVFIAEFLSSGEGIHLDHWVHFIIRLRKEAIDAGNTTLRLSGSLKHDMLQALANYTLSFIDKHTNWPKYTYQGIELRKLLDREITRLIQDGNRDFGVLAQKRQDIVREMAFLGMDSHEDYLSITCESVYNDHFKHQLNISYEDFVRRVLEADESHQEGNNYPNSPTLLGLE